MTMLVPFHPRPLRIGARPELDNRSAVPLPPKPVVIPKIGPEVTRGRGLAACVEREMMSILVDQRGLPCLPQSQESLVEPVSSDSRHGRTRSDGAAPGTIEIDVVTERIGH